MLEHEAKETAWGLKYAGMRRFSLRKFANGKWGAALAKLKGELEQEATTREEEVLRLLMERLSIPEIAVELDVTAATVKKHIEVLRGKYGVKSAPQLIAEAYIRLQKARMKITPLEGHWLSRFEFQNFIRSAESPLGQLKSGGQIDLEQIEKVRHDYFTFKGTLMKGVRSGDLPPYEHVLRLREVDGYVIGTWENENTHNVGCFHLTIHSAGNSLVGLHLGNTSNGAVLSGKWTWVRVRTKLPRDWAERALRPYDELNELFDLALETSKPFSAEELFT
jgi:DNA-binding CsgD family transcriptional regulator